MLRSFLISFAFVFILAFPAGRAQAPANSDQLRLEFEREKWRDELNLRTRELTLREREQASKEAELASKRREQPASPWSNPLVLAILAAAIAAIGNAVVATVNGRMQRRLEVTRRAAELELEASKAESSRILEMIKTGDTERAASNMEFLLKSGLITNEERTARLAQYLKEREPGTGPSLPTAAAPFSFEPAESLTKPVQDRLQKSLDEYIAYLATIGFAPSGGTVKIRVDKKVDANTAYSQETKVLTIGEKMLGDVSVALQTYTYHVLQGAQPSAGDESNLQLGTIEVALADYFTASFLREPRLGQLAAQAVQPGLPYIRTLENERKFAELRGLKNRNDMYRGAEVWDGLLWAVRQQIGQDAADAAIADAWRTVKWPGARSKQPAAFLGAILSSLEDKGAARQSADVEAIARSRGFPLPA